MLDKCIKSHLNNSWVLRQVAGTFGSLTNCQVLYITPSKDDVLKDFISGRNWSISGSIFSPQRTNCRKKDVEKQESIQ